MVVESPSGWRFWPDRDVAAMTRRKAALRYRRLEGEQVLFARLLAA
jgi:hypothetical protein